MGWDMKIEGLDKVIEGLDSNVHTEIFTRVVNDVVPSVAVATMKQVKKEWNIGTKRLKLDNGKYAKPHTWYFTRKGDNKSSSRTGRVRFVPANPKGVRHISYLNVLSGAIPLSLFETNPDYSDSNLRKPPKKRKKIRYKLKKRTKTMATSTDAGYVFRAVFESGHEGIFFRPKGKTILMEDYSITPTTMFDRAGIDKFAKTIWSQKALRRYEHYLDMYTRGAWKS